jgi:hypothetical protein
MDRLASHPIAARHLRNRRAFFQNLQHRPVPLLHHTQLHQHTRPPPLRPARDRRETNRTAKGREPPRSVAYLPELPSASSRNRIRNLSPRNQNRCVKHLPDSHTRSRERRRQNGDALTAASLGWVEQVVRHARHRSRSRPGHTPGFPRGSPRSGSAAPPGLLQPVPPGRLEHGHGLTPHLRSRFMLTPAAADCPPLHPGGAGAPSWRPGFGCTADDGGAVSVR